MDTNTNTRNVVTVVSIVVLSFFVGFFTNQITTKKPIEPKTETAITSEQVREGGYKFINPLLECEVGKNQEMSPFKDKILKTIEANQNLVTTSHISVYFRDLDNGPWFGTNVFETFSPASLSKVPLLMSLLKKAEADPTILDIKVQIPKDPSLFETKQQFNTGGDLPNFVGKELTISELAARMIIDSDNAAASLISNYLTWNEIAEPYNKLKIPLDQPEKDPKLTVVEYASFFRVLYNASYLDKFMSEKALSLMSETKFKEGLRAGIPEDISVSHKFGERKLEDTGVIQLHDCGIVYYPGHPFVLCIMTRGTNYNDLIKLIREVTKETYNQVKSQNGRPN